MPIDGLMLHGLQKELSALIGARVDKITQPERDEVVLNLYFRKNVRLLLSANSAHPRVQLTECPRENPAQAPNFSMLLRKHLTGAKLIGVEQPGLERVLVFRFECRTDLHDIVEKRLIAEVMGRCSNIILTDASGRIFDAIRQVDFSASSRRQVLPGLTYQLPPSQGKLPLSSEVPFPWDSDEKIERWLTGNVEGVSPLLARETAFRAAGNCDASFGSLSSEQRARLDAFWTQVCRCAETGECRPVMLVTDRPREVYCMEILQYGPTAETRPFDTLSEALDAFYVQRDRAEHLRRNSADLSKLLSNLTARLSRKISAQQGELAQCEEAESFRKYGDLILSNLSRFRGGEKTVRLPDYEADGAEIDIPFDPSFSASRNAQAYYKKYKKSRTAKQVLTRQLQLAQEELSYMASVRDALSRAGSVEEIGDLRRELAQSGYLKKAPAPRSRKTAPLPPARYRSSDGFLILSGRNNLQNDALTLHTAEKRDVWFHVKNAPGSHTVLVTEGKDPTDLALTQAAIIAATNSSVSEGGTAAVDYTQVRNVHKPAGARPGMVIYDNYRTAYVKPDPELCEKLKF